MTPTEMERYVGRKITFRMIGGQFTYRGEVLPTGKVAIKSKGQLFQVGPNMISEVVE